MTEYDLHVRAGGGDADIFEWLTTVVQAIVTKLSVYPIRLKRMKNDTLVGHEVLSLLLLLLL